MRNQKQSLIASIAPTNRCFESFAPNSEAEVNRILISWPSNRAMKWDTRKIALPLFGPLLLIAVGFIFIGPIQARPRAVAEAAFLAPFVLAALGVVLALLLRRRRAIYLFAVLLISHWVLQALIPSEPGKDALGQVVYAATAILLPLNLTFFALLGQRKVLSLHGMSHITLIGLQVAVVAVAADAAFSQTAAKLLHARAFHKDFDYWTYLPQPAILLFAAAATVLLSRTIWKRTPFDAGILGALLASAAALHVVGRGAAPALFFSVAMAALILALIQQAYHMVFQQVDKAAGPAGSGGGAQNSRQQRYDRHAWRGPLQEIQRRVRSWRGGSRA